MNLLQFPDDPFLRRSIIRPCKLAEAAVGCHNDPDGAVLGNDLSGAHLSSLRQRNFLLKPRRPHHPRLIALGLSHSAFHHVAHAVNEPQIEACTILQIDSDGLFGHKLRFRRHNGASRAALRQLILGPFPQIYVLHIGQHQLFHKALDKGGFSGAHRANYTDINVPCRPGSNILIDRAVCHISILFSQKSFTELYAPDG